MLEDEGVPPRPQGWIHRWGGAGVYILEGLAWGQLEGWAQRPRSCTPPQLTSAPPLQATTSMEPWSPPT